MNFYASVMYLAFLNKAIRVFYYFDQLGNTLFCTSCKTLLFLKCELSPKEAINVAARKHRDDASCVNTPKMCFNSQLLPFPHSEYRIGDTTINVIIIHITQYGSVEFTCSSQRKVLSSIFPHDRTV